MKGLRTIIELLEMIKFGHSVLALPFAFMGALLAARGLPDGRTLFFILVAMVAARSAAMAFNRLADARFDVANPRTADRALPAGKISRRATILFIGVSAVLFMGAAAQLNRVCFVLSPVVLLVILGYSFTKRFTIASHLVLGLCLGLAPVGGWLAVRGVVTIGTIAAFISYSRRFAEPLRQLGNLYNQVQGALAGAERIFEIIDTIPDQTDALQASELSRVSG